MNTVRPAAVAGRFYPSDPAQLRTSINRMLAKVEVPDDEPLAPAYVVPHAGYRFSGPIAAHVYARIRRHATAVDRVVLIGPSHYVALRGCAVSPAEAWHTPLGTVPVAPLPDITSDAAPHASEHSLEVQVPFLQQTAGEFTITPVAVGVTPAEEVADALDAATADGPGTVVVCSTDLSHYHNDETAKELDARTAQAVTDLRFADIQVKQACGVFALRGLVAWAARHKHRPRLLDLRTSADTFGGPERVVGYPAFAVEAP